MDLAALDFRLWLGGEEKINGYCHALALAGGKAMAAILGTEVMHGKDEDELTLNMVCCPSLPLRHMLPKYRLTRTYAILHIR